MKLIKLLIHLVFSALAVWITAKLLPGVELTSTYAPLIVAVVLGLVNILVKPILVVLTLPVTLVTLGLFYVVINALMILIADALVDSFEVGNFWWAILFSVVLSIVNAILSPLYKTANK